MMIYYRIYNIYIQYTYNSENNSKHTHIYIYINESRSWLFTTYNNCYDL